MGGTYCPRFLRSAVGFLPVGQKREKHPRREPSARGQYDQSKGVKEDERRER